MILNYYYETKFSRREFIKIVGGRCWTIRYATSCWLSIRAWQEIPYFLQHFTPARNITIRTEDLNQNQRYRRTVLGVEDAGMWRCDVLEGQFTSRLLARGPGDSSQCLRRRRARARQHLFYSFDISATFYGSLLPIDRRGRVSHDNITAAVNSCE